MTGMLRNLKEVLTEVITDSSKIFIVGHNEPDFDSIGSAIALGKICNLFNRRFYIIVNEPDMALEPGVKRIVDECREKYNIIDLDTFKKLVDKNSSLIITDTNKEKLISVKEYLPDFKHKVIVDHHKEDENTVEADYKFVSSRFSSASEMIARILNSYRLRYDSKIASYLLAGIELDTKHFQNNTFPTTHGVAEALLARGANRAYINSLFITDFETDRRISNLVFNGSLFEVYEKSIFQKRKVAFALKRENPEFIYKKEDLAKAADRLLGYDVDASFAIGHVDKNTVSISARSRSDIDVGSIMSQLGGGGTTASAACKISNKVPNEVENMLKDIVKETIVKEPIDIDIEATSTIIGTIIDSHVVKVKSM